jgi:hypothetical protein
MKTDAVMSQSTTAVLAQCERANAGNQPYKPTAAFSGTADRAREDGLLLPGIFGGFWLTETGKRQLAASRR